MKHPCVQCGDRPAVFRTNKDRHMRADKHHDLCSKCQQSLTERLRRKAK